MSMNQSTPKIQSNLDPAGRHSDKELMAVLEKVQMLNCLQNLENGLDSLLTTGQKPLLCLARTLLDKHNCLILDEATANIDQVADAVIQQLIRKQFTGRTIITVTHLLNTVIDYDVIVVLAQGRQVESGSAWNLWRKDGQFRSMIMESGEERHSLITELQAQSKIV